MNPYPAGFGAWGLECGVAGKPGRKDVALFYSDRPAQSAAVFTTNRVQAAPVLVSASHIKKSSTARAVLMNSGCANACTGKRGLADARWSAQTVANALRLKQEEVLIASTGVIGRFLNKEALGKGIDALTQSVLQEKPRSFDEASIAIMTTDTRPKTASASLRLDGERFRVWGCAKGAGMIHPNMATMLSVILTDAGVPAARLRRSLKRAAEESFNQISVDGDTSTNDTVFLLANGAAGPVPASGQDAFDRALDEVCVSLARQVVEDGEGVTRTAEILVKGAATRAAAKKLAETVATSPLFKTALHGADPNWGRVMAALGRAGVAFDPSKVDIRFGGLLVCKRGGSADMDPAKLAEVLKAKHVQLVVDLRGGAASSRYWTCDFSKDYVAINADYTT